MAGENDTPVPDHKVTVFLSYARADQVQAARIVRALENAGLNLWWDALIDGGATFAKSIETALDECDAVVVLWSRQSVASDWVRDEAAKGRDLRKLVPASLDGTTAPLGFGQYHAVDLSRWRGGIDAEEIALVVRGIAAAIGRTAPIVERADTRRRFVLSRRQLVTGVAGAAFAGGGGYVAWQRLMRSGISGAADNSVAVLPFHNLSGNPNEAYFADGVAEEIRATLARSGRFLVMAETSSAKFRDRAEDAIAIARQLGVAFLLVGSVRRSSALVRISADLVEGATGFSRWSQSFDRRATDIFAVQSEIARAASGALLAQVDHDTTTRPAPAQSSGATSNLTAYDAYLRGRALYELSADETSERLALAQFDAAIAADPNFAAAHAARAGSLAAIASQYGTTEQLSRLYDAALAAAQRAVAIAPDFADAYATIGTIYFQGRLDARAAREPFDRARQLGKGLSGVLRRFALFAARTGRHGEAESAMATAVVLDPLNAAVHRASGSVRYAARRYADSLPPLRRALNLNPKMVQVHAQIGNALLLLGRLLDAGAAYALEPDKTFSLPGEAIIAHRQGSNTRATAAFTALVQGFGDRVLYQQAQVLAQWHQLDRALATLERARILGDTGMVYADNDPFLDPLRKEPRFTVLLKSVGFE